MHWYSDLFKTMTSSEQIRNDATLQGLICRCNCIDSFAGPRWNKSGSANVFHPLAPPKFCRDRHIRVPIRWNQGPVQHLCHLLGPPEMLTLRNKTKPNHEKHHIIYKANRNAKPFPKSPSQQISMWYSEQEQERERLPLKNNMKALSNYLKQGCLEKYLYLLQLLNWPR